MKVRIRADQVMLYVVLIVLAAVMIYPFLWSVTASFKTNRQIFSGNPLDLIPRSTRIAS